MALANGSQLQCLKDVGAESSRERLWIAGLFQAEKGWIDHFPSAQCSNDSRLQHLEVGRAESSHKRLWFVGLLQAEKG